MRMRLSCSSGASSTPSFPLRPPYTAAAAMVFLRYKGRGIRLLARLLGGGGAAATRVFSSGGFRGYLYGQWTRRPIQSQASDGPVIFLSYYLSSCRVYTFFLAKPPGAFIDSQKQLQRSSDALKQNQGFIDPDMTLQWKKLLQLDCEPPAQLSLSITVIKHNRAKISTQGEGFILYTTSTAQIISTTYKKNVSASFIF